MTEPEQADGPEPEIKATESPSQAKPGAGGGISVVAAVVLALAALAASGYALWQLRDLQTLPDRIQADKSRNVSQYRDLEQRLEQINNSTQAHARSLETLQSTLVQEVTAGADTSLQISQLEQRITAMTGSDASRRNRFLRAEAVYYLRIANARVLLARDARTAVSALQLADNKLRETGDPALVPVRAKLSEELAALRAVPEVDTTGMSLSLQSLAGQVDGWPSVRSVPDSFKQELPGLDQSSEDAWLRFKNTVREIFDNIVSVRRDDAPPELQLSAAEQALVVEGIRAELQLARLTLINGDTALYAQSLRGVASQIARYFDTEDSAVSAALTTVKELLTVELPQELPDISVSLQLLLEADAAAGEQTEADAGSEAP